MEVPANSEFVDEEKIKLKKLKKNFIKITKRVIILKKIISEDLEGLLEDEYKEEMDDEIKISVFDDRCYSTWKKRLLTFLKFKKFDKVVKREKVDDDVDNFWNEKEMKAANYTYSAFSNHR